MEPINQKERTTAFIQFMVMFVIAIILVVCLTLFDKKLCHDDYADLQAKLNECQKQKSELPANLSYQIDSVYQVILTINESDGIKFDEDKGNKMKDLEILWFLGQNEKSASEETAIKRNVLTVFNAWLNSKKAIISYGERSSDVKDLNKTIDKLREDLRAKQSELNDCLKLK